MKKLFTIISLFVVMTVQAQTVTKDAAGNYHAVTRQRDTTANKATGATFTDSKGKVYPVFISSRGKLYYNRVSRNGNTYKAYLKTDSK